MAVEVVNAQGERGTVDEADVAQLVASGGRALTADDLAAEARQAELTSAGGKAIAAVTGADEALGGIGTGFALGIHRDLYGRQATNDAQDEISAMREANPGAALAGNVLGGLAMPGLGIELGTETAAARIGGMALEGAAQGAIQGVGTALTEETLGNPDANAEGYFASEMAKGFLLGGAAGGGIGAVGEGARMGLQSFARTMTGGDRAAARELMGGYRQAEASVEGLMGTGKFTLPEAQAIASESATLGQRAGLDAGGVIDNAFASVEKRFAGQSPEVAEAMRTTYKYGRDIAAKTESELDDMSRKLSANLDRLGAAKDLLYEQNIVGKGRRMAELVDASKGLEAMDAVVGMIRNVRETAASIDGYMGGKGLARNLEREADRIEQKIAGGMSPADLFMEADNLKRNVGKLQRLSRGPSVEGAVQSEFLNLYESGLRAPLENAAVWGEPATAAQREVNQAWAQLLETGGDLSRYFRTDFGKDLTGRLERSDAGKFKSFLSKVSDPSADLPREALLRQIDGMENAIAASERHYGADAAYDEARAAIREMRDGLGSAEQRAKVIETLRSQSKAEGEGLGLGGILGIASDVAMRPLKTAERLASLRDAVVRVDKGLTQAVDNLFGKGSGAARKAATREETKAASESVRQLAGNPPAIMARLEKALSGLSSSAPQHARAISAVASRAVAHLGAVAPAGRKSFSMLRPDEKPRYTDSELDSFARRMRVIEDPMSVVDDAANGRLTLEQMQTLRAVYPSIYDSIRQKAYANIERLKRTGEIADMPYAKRLSIGILLDLPADATMEPDFVQLLQASKQPEQPQQQDQVSPQDRGVPRRVEIDRSFMSTDAQRLEEGTP